MGKKSLGRSLDSIFKDHALPDTLEGTQVNGIAIQKIPLDLIDPNPFQPRRIFSDEELSELAETILEHGLIQPITVRKHSGRYQIVSGERRMRASKLAGFTEIDARVFDLLSDKSMMEWAIIENIQRVDLNPVEVAASYQQLIQNHGYTHEDLAKRLGKSRSAVTNSLRLLKLPATVLSWIEEGKLSAGHARTLLGPDISDPEKVAREIIDQGMNVRQAERKSAPPAKNTKTVEPMDPNLNLMLQDVQYALGTRVRLVQKGKGRGELLVEFENFDDLTRICDTLKAVQV